MWKRVMSFKDEDYEKAKNIANLPEVKLYERAGKGIVVPMLEDILKELFFKDWNKITILIRKEVSFFWFFHIMYCKGDKESPKK